MIQRRVSLLLSSLLLLPLWGCGDSTPPPAQNQVGQAQQPPAIVRPETQQQVQNLQDGQYPVQQASFDDASGEYTLMLLNTPAGMSSTLQVKDLPMARLSDEQIKAGEKSYVKIAGGKPEFYLTEDFKIEYQHTVTEVQQNPQTGERETVIVKRESNFWSPFLGSMTGSIAGQAIGAWLFRPQYYVPPLYQPGVMVGYGGYGPTYVRAVEVYRERYREAPIVERNRTTFRSTGKIRNIAGSSQRQLPSGRGRSFSPTTRTRVPEPVGGAVERPKASQPRVSDFNKSKSTGSGYGSSNLRKTGKSYRSPSIGNERRGGSFGSSSRSRGSFGSSRSSGRRR
jgi:hypothetical protein